MNPKVRVGLKILELLSCVACILMKIYTDNEASRLYYLNRKLSREWGLLNNVTWSEAGNAFANITYGGYTLITALMVISRCIDSKSHPTVFEKFFLGFGVILFFAMGGLVIGSLHQIPRQLYDNAIILGCMSIFTGILFIIDLTDPLYSSSSSHTQANLPSVTEESHSYQLGEKLEVNSNVLLKNVQPLGVQIAARDMPLLDRHRSTQLEEPIVFPGRYSHLGLDASIQTVNLPKRQQPILESVKDHRHDNHDIPISHISNKPWKDSLFDNFSQQQTYRQPRPSLVQNENHGYLPENSYAKGIIVDENCCTNHNQRTPQSSSFSPGYVSSIAKMWEKRTKPTPPHKPKKNQMKTTTTNDLMGLQTIV